MASKYHYICINCNAEYQANEVTYLCPACEADNNTYTPPKGVLKTVYNYSEIAQKLQHFDNLKAERNLSLLPLQSAASMGYLRVGNTPLYKIDAEKEFGLYLKDDSQNPSFSFKDRASVLVSSYAKENNISTIVAASTGNAGSSLACICASQQQNAVIFVPAKAPLAKLTQIIMYGARIVPVDGNYDMAFDLSIEAGRHFGWYNRNTAYNPFTIEGKKTVSFEIFDQLQQQIPDCIFVPVGDGVIISGIYKGFEDLLNLGFIDQMPVIIAVQSEQSKNLTANIYSENWQTYPSDTLADSISVDIPRNFYMAKDYLLKYNGEILTVSDEKIIEASVQLSKQTGIFAEPAAATAFAGYLNYKNQNLLKTGSENVVMLTGSGLKDLKSLSPVINMPKPIKADISSVIDYLNSR
jgi:threonine synthase